MRMLFLILATLLFAGCTRPEPVSRSAVVTFKTPKFKVHDTAFVITRGRDVTIEVYTAGTLVLDIRSGSMICINGGCMSDDRFIAEYLSPDYPDRIIARIVGKEKLEMEGAVTTPLPDGFSQRIKSKGLYDISYVVHRKEVFFRDRLNHIIIAVRLLD